ncbi:hypothetical protein [Streptomyces sp. NPDC002746]
MTAADGRTALIIGASRGLGYALASEYLSRGRRVTATVRGTGRTGPHDLGGPAARLTTDQSIPGVVDTVEAQRAKGGLRFLDYEGRTVR